MMHRLSAHSLCPEFKDIVEIRSSICSECPNLVVKSDNSNKIFQGKCGVCGCSFPAIVYSKSKKCPEGRWSKFTEDNPK